MVMKTFLSSAFVLALMSAMVQGQVDYNDVKTPQNVEWLKYVDMSSVPMNPIRAVGSGVCPESKCDGIDNDPCFESCGNTPSPDDIYGCPQDHNWALTFDDGPSNYTNELLDILDRENVKATFCVMGAHVEQYPEVLKRAYESGHQIASHTYSHPHLMSLTNEEIIYEVKATEEAIEKVIGIKPHYIRPPFGEADVRVKALLKSMGYKVLLWNVDPTDYDVYMLRNVSTLIQGSFKMAVQGNDTGLNLHEDPGFISLQHGNILKLKLNIGYSILFS
jgi:peptidoglycan/xylan/chitin deacetylase (PgdA/CDA1 family)